MNLYFVRHGTALDHHNDEKRELSSTGKRQARKLGRFLRKAEVRLTNAYTSPLIRARQTAEILLDITNEGKKIDLNFAGAMLNATTVEDFRDWLSQLGKGGDVLLVGHEPSLSDRIRALLRISGAATFEMKKGACACIRTTNCKTGVLKFHITPKSLGL